MIPCNGFTFSVAYFSVNFNNLYYLGKRIVPIQALVPTAVHSGGTPAQPAYPAVHLESTTRATCEYPTTGTGGSARTQLSSKTKYKRNPPPVPQNHYREQGCSPIQAHTPADRSCNPTKEKSTPPLRRNDTQGTPQTSRHKTIYQPPTARAQPHVAQAPSVTPPQPGKNQLSHPLHQLHKTPAKRSITTVN